MVFGQVHAGHAANVIPTQAELSGTLRVRGRVSWDSGAGARRVPGGGHRRPFGADYELDYQRGSPPVDNDPQAVAVLRAATHAALGPEAGVPTQQSVGNEDFSWLLRTGPRRLRAARCAARRRTPLGRPPRRRLRHRRGRHPRRRPAAGPHRPRGTVGLRRVTGADRRRTPRLPPDPGARDRESGASSPLAQAESGETDAFAYDLPEAAIAQTPDRAPGRGPPAGRPGAGDGARGPAPWPTCPRWCGRATCSW